MTTFAQFERGQFNEPDSHVDIEAILQRAEDEGWKGDDWQDAADFLRERDLQVLYPEEV